MSDKQAHGLAGTAGKSKARSGRAGARSVARPRLIDAMKQARHRRCLSLQGPAGSGKTTVLGAWRRELVAGGVEVAWLALEAADHEAARFVDTLLVALTQIDAAMVREAVELAGRGDAAGAIEGIAIALVRGIAAHRKEVALVFDDAHHLRDARIVGALQLLLDHGPPNLLCVFASRNPLALSLARLRDQGELLELGFEALRFTPAESALLVKSLLDDADDRQARALHHQTDGWAAGLKLLCLERRRRGGAQRVADECVRDAKAFARYFEDEVMSRLAPEELRFVLHCAVPEQFDAALCAALQGDVAAPAGPAALLSRLESQGLLLVPAGPRYPEGWWRLHPLLRDVLRARVEALPASERQRLHSTASRWFAQGGMQHDAVQHALQAGDLAAAVALVDAAAAELFVAGDLRRLVGLVRQLPEAVVRERISLRLWMAWVQVYERRLADCARSIAQLQQDMAQAAPAERYRLTLLRGLYAVQSDDAAAAMAILPELQNVPPEADAIVHSGRRNLLTWIHLYRCDYEQARLVQLEQPPRMPHGEPLYGTPFGVLSGRCLIGLSHAVEGQVIQAERIYRDVLFEAERRGASCVDAACLARGLLGEVLYELNDAAGAARLLEERLDVLERVSIPDTVLRVMLVMGRAHWLAGRPLDAIAYVEQTHDEAERLGLDRIRAYCQMELVRYHLQRNAPALAQQSMDLLERLVAGHAGEAVETLSDLHLASERARIEIDLHRGALQSALARIEALERVCRDRGRVRRIASLRLQAAAAERLLHNSAKVRVHVREALRWGHQLGLVRTLLDAHAAVAGLVQEALNDIRDDPVLVFYAERLLAAARVRPEAASAAAAPAADAGRRLDLAQLSPRETQIVHLLLQAMPNKKIARVLDLSLDTVKWHLKNCYGKLGVSGRDEVIERLRDLDQA